MKWYVNLKTATKLISAFIVTAILAGIMGFYGLSNMQTSNDSLNLLYSKNLLSIQYLNQAAVNYSRIRIALRDIALFTNVNDQNKRMTDIQKMSITVEENLNSFRKIGNSPAKQAAMQKIDANWATYKKLLDDAIQLKKSGQNDEYITFLTKNLAKTGDDLKALLDDGILNNMQQAEQAQQDSDKAYQKSRVVTLAFVLLVVALSIIFGIVIARIISRPLNKIVSVVTKVASGDLRQRLDIESKDEIGTLANSVNHMVDNLRVVVGGIIESSQSVASASEQISASTQEIASGSTNQAQSANAITELFKELSSAINSAAASAEHASELSDQTLQTATEGGKVVEASVNGMQKVNDSMSRLEEDSQKIGDIIEVIDDIADQTNLLALNAAIEAARAGDQGRGFAVVADEVRKLAERSSGATKEITSIIKKMQQNTKESVTAVLESVTQSTQTGEAFNGIVMMVNNSFQKVNEIATACEEEAAQASEVLQAVESIAAASEEAAAASEETAATCQSLAELAQDLNDSVSQFKI